MQWSSLFDEQSSAFHADCSLTPHEAAAWALLCEETAGDMHVFDFWQEVPPAVQQKYLAKVKQ